MSLRKYHDVELEANDAAKYYAPCSQPHSKLILTASLLKFLQIKS